MSEEVPLYDFVNIRGGGLGLRGGLHPCVCSSCVYCGTCGRGQGLEFGVWGVLHAVGYGGLGSGCNIWGVGFNAWRGAGSMHLIHMLAVHHIDFAPRFFTALASSSFAPTGFNAGIGHL